MSDPGGGEVGSNLYDLLGIPLAQSGTNPSPFGWGAISQAIFHPGTGLVLPPGGGAYDPSTGTNLGPSVPGAAGSYRGDSGGGLIGSGPDARSGGAVPFDDYGYPASPQKEYFSILDFICALGDEASLGLTVEIRRCIGVDHVVNMNSSSYKWGQIASIPLGPPIPVARFAKGAKRLVKVLDEVPDPNRFEKLARQAADELGIDLEKLPSLIAAPLDGAHGNTLNNSKCWLYAVVTEDGRFLKWGISKKPGRRYTRNELGNARVKKLFVGPRAQIATLERWLVERYRGPLNRERWAAGRLE